MATLDDLRTRLIAETNRDDLSDDLAAALNEVIQRAIEYYALQRFTFNETTATGVTVAGNQYVTLPTGIRRLDMLEVTVGANRYPLTARDYAEIQQWQGYSSSSGQPTDYSVSEGQVRLYLTPNIAYTLSFTGIKDVTPALNYAVGTSSNAWLVQGYDLIAARCRYLLYRDYFRDDAGASIALGAEQEAMARLRNEASRLLGTGRTRASW